MNKPQLDEVMRSIYRFHGANPPIGVLAENLAVIEQEALELWEEFLLTVPKEPPKPKKRAMKRKTPIKAAKMESTKKPKKPTRKAHKMHDVAIKVLPWGAALIAVISLVRSVLFTFHYFLRTEDIVIAGLMGGLFGLVIFLAPSILIYAIQMRKWAIVGIAAVAVGLFGVLNVYIVVEELNYTKMQKEIAYTEAQESILAGRARLPMIEQELRDNTENKAKDTTEYKNLTELSIAAFTNEDKTVYNRTRNNMATVQERIGKYEQNDMLLKNERKAIQDLPGFYTEVVLTSDDRERSRQMDMLFGISLEVVGVVFLAIALYL